MLVACAAEVGDGDPQVAKALAHEPGLDDALPLGVGDVLEQRGPIVGDLDGDSGRPRRRVVERVTGARRRGREARGARPQLELVHERQAVQIRGRPDLSRIDAFASEEVLVVRHRFGRVRHGVAHALVPTGQELLARKVRGLPLTRHVPEHGQRPVTLLEEVHCDRTI